MEAGLGTYLNSKDGYWIFYCQQKNDQQDNRLAGLFDSCPQGGIPIVVSIVSCAPIWPPTNHFLKGLEFPRLAKVVSRMVWSFRARRKSFPEWFGVSAHGESHFPNGLEFPRMAKVISRMVWSFRAWRKLFPEWFGISCCKDMEINGSA